MSRRPLTRQTSPITFGKNDGDRLHMAMPRILGPDAGKASVARFRNRERERLAGVNSRPQ